MTQVLVFGEDPNDTGALRELILGLCPSLRANQVRTLREPPTLQRGAHLAAVRRWVERATAALQGAQLSHGAAVCIFVHSDADGPDDGSFEAARTQELREAGFPQAHAVVPIESIESWWLLFPEATESVVPTWRGALLKRSRDVDRVSSPKQELVSRTRKKQPKRPYREGDSPRIAAAIVSSGQLRSPAGRSASYHRFVDAVDRCCSAVSAALLSDRSTDGAGT